jgi:two-component system phosphate regulon sensor histidine kinase PhoR
MPPDRPLRRWLHVLRNPSGMLALVAVATAVTFGVAGWEMLRQESSAEEQRQRERLAGRADRAVQAIERALGKVNEQLDATLVSRSEPAIPREGLVLIFDQASIQRVFPTNLAFYPVLPAEAAPPDALFAQAEADEYQRNGLTTAAAVYRRLAQSSDAAVRATALMGLARVLKHSNEPEAALHVYRELAEVPEARVVGAPAALVARNAEMRLVEELGRKAEAEALARDIQRDLAAGRWALTQGQFEHHAAESARVLGTEMPPDPRLALAYAVTDFWTAWHTAPAASGSLVAGRTGDKSDDRHIDGYSERYIAAWRSGGGVTAAAVWPLRQLLAQLPADVRQGISFVDRQGTASDREQAEASIVRTSIDTGLPFSVRATGDNALAQYGLMSRGRLVVAALSVMLAFLLVASYFISRAVKREMALARLQADFVSAVSHEFRTPLASMRQLSELLAAGRVPLEARRQHYYESIAGESRRLQRLVENLLEFGKLEAGPRPYRIEPVGPRELMDSAVADFRSQLGRTDCRIDVSGEITTPVLVDRDAMTLVLHNLLDNAVKYSGGASVRLCCEPEGDRIAFSVSDDGPGISTEDQQRMFQKFVRGASAVATNVKGTGLGLAMVKLIVSGHGGEIRVNSRPDAGSTFTVILPAQV